MHLHTKAKHEHTSVTVAFNITTPANQHRDSELAQPLSIGIHWKGGSTHEHWPATGHSSRCTVYCFANEIGSGVRSAPVVSVRDTQWKGLVLKSTPGRNFFRISGT